MKALIENIIMNAEHVLLSVASNREYFTFEALDGSGAVLHRMRGDADEMNSFFHNMQVECGDQLIAAHERLASGEAFMRDLWELSQANPNPVTSLQGLTTSLGMRSACEDLSRLEVLAQALSDGTTMIFTVTRMSAEEWDKVGSALPPKHSEQPDLFGKRPDMPGLN